MENALTFVEADNRPRAKSDVGGIITALTTLFFARPCVRYVHTSRESHVVGSYAKKCHTYSAGVYYVYGVILDITRGITV